MEKKTPLYSRHEKLNGKIVPFAGYLLPVQYETGVIKEHKAVREGVGIFDVSHMGEVFFEGEDALENLNNLFTNDFTSMKEGAVRYSPMCNDCGGVVDDLIVYKFDDKKYMVVVNASNKDKDVDWIKSHLIGEVKFTDVSEYIGQLALQGRLAKGVLGTLVAEDKISQKYYSFVDGGVIANKPCLISRTGYTGEDGFEIYAKAEDIGEIFDDIMEIGKPFGLIPCGLGARDTLRLEASMPLYGHEMDDDISPLETGLDFGVKMSKQNFIGKEGIEKRLPLSKKRVGLKILDRGIAREHEKVFGENGEEIGVTTSGTFLPTLNGAYAMAILKIDYAKIGKKVFVEVRGKKLLAEVVPMPFYKKNY